MKAQDGVGRLPGGVLTDRKVNALLNTRNSWVTKVGTGINSIIELSSLDCRSVFSGH